MRENTGIWCCHTYVASKNWMFRAETSGEIVFFYYSMALDSVPKMKNSLKMKNLSLR